MRRSINLASDTKEHSNAYFAKAVAAYNNGDYEEALTGFEKLYKFIEADTKITFIPHIERCKRIVKKPLALSDRQHLVNQAVLKYFGWLDKLKYVTALSGFMILSLCFWGATEDTSPLALLARNLKYLPIYLVLALAMGTLTVIIHEFMGRFSVSKGLIRCKYCGEYTGNPPICACDCGKSDPAPDFLCDGWDGLEYSAHDGIL